MIGWIVPIVFLALSIFLLCGRGSWLIAGYNAFSKEEKKNVDEKRLCREVGILLLVLAIIKIINQVVSVDFPDVPISIAVIIVFFAYGAVKKKKKK